MSIFYDVVCEKFVSILVGCEWARCIGSIVGFIAGGGG